MACNRMPSLSTGDQFRLPLGADWLRHPAPGTEAASRWRVDGAGHFSCQDDAFALAALVRIRDRGCGEQSLGIRVAGLAIHLFHGPRFDDLRSEEHTSELQSLMRISYAVFCLKKTTINTQLIIT